MKLSLWRAWRIARWPLGILLVLYIALVIYRIPAVTEKQETEEAVTRIQAQKLTLEHVNGEHLPPPPDPALVDATIEGVDANANGIRDDVELAIFAKYPNDPKIRAAELQYAMALQGELTEVFNSETLVAVIRQESRGNICILDSKRAAEVEKLTFNISVREIFREELYKKFMTSYALPNSDFCDIDPKTFDD